MPMHLRSTVVAAREKLAEGRERLRAQHQSGSPGIQVCAGLADLIDSILLDLYQAALEEIGDRALEEQIALVVHGGLGRRDVAPYSDVDLMLLHSLGNIEQLAPFARKLTHSLYDTGLQLGFSVRSSSEACGLALRDATIFTSLAESRFLGGHQPLFRKFLDTFRRKVRRRYRSLAASIEQARREERHQYGETVYLLRPNIKRSPGALRDIQLVRWIGFARYGGADPDYLQQLGHLSPEDRTTLRSAHEFLLRLRNEMHFHARKPQDVLDTEEQLRLAAVYGYSGEEGVLPVEQFMRDYFRHTSEVRYTLAHFLAGTRASRGVSKLLGPLFSHQFEKDFLVGPVHIGATRRGLAKLRSSPAEVLRLMDVANLYDKRIDHDTWQLIRREMATRPPEPLTPEAAERFLSLLSQPAQLGELLRRLHELRVLEQLVPGMSHARCLVQFNEYHKFTVDEHCIRAVECATEFLGDPDVLGDVYRRLPNKRILHLALLLHDLGKGYAEDHSEVGLQLAAETAERLGLPDREAEAVKFLVHKHLLMSHLALWRNIEDEQVVVQFAVEVGSPELLQMLFVLTCADLAAVGPGVLNQWKLTLLTELYLRAMRHLAGERGSQHDGRVNERRAEILQQVREEGQAWFARQLDELPSSYLLTAEPKQIVAQLERLRQLSPEDAFAVGTWNADRSAVEYTVGTHESITPGVFHKLTGALSSKGLQILTAEIHTLERGLVLDRFFVQDLDYAGEPPAERLAEVCQALVSSLKERADQPPAFRRIWTAGGTLRNAAHQVPTRVRIDNTTAEQYTIVDIFTSDRIGLLYVISRTLFELGLSVHIAKIGTHLDQVVDVFYVTDQHDQKIGDESRLQEIRTRLLTAIEQHQPPR